MLTYLGQMKARGSIRIKQFPSQVASLPQNTKKLAKSIHHELIQIIEAIKSQIEKIQEERAKRRLEKELKEQEEMKAREESKLQAIPEPQETLVEEQKEAPTPTPEAKTADEVKESAKLEELQKQLEAMRQQLELLSKLNLASLSIPSAPSTPAVNEPVHEVSSSSSNSPSSFVAAPIAPPLISAPVAPPLAPIPMAPALVSAPPAPALNLSVPQAPPMTFSLSRRGSAVDGEDAFEPGSPYTSRSRPTFEVNIPNAPSYSSSSSSAVPTPSAAHPDFSAELAATKLKPVSLSSNSQVLQPSKSSNIPASAEKKPVKVYTRAIPNAENLSHNDLIMVSSKIALRKTNVTRSPGGTPIKETSASNSYFVNALQSKFKSARASSDRTSFGTPVRGRKSVLSPSKENWDTE